MARVKRRIPADIRAAGTWLIVLGAVQAPLWLMNPFFWASSAVFFICGSCVRLGSRFARQAAKLLCLTMEVLLLSKLLEGATYGPPPSSPARELAGVFCLALLFVAFGVPIFLLIRGRKSKEDDQTCGNCGYDLQGLAHGPCPECGADIPGDQPSTNLDPDAHHHKRMDLGSQKKRFLLAFAAIPIVAALIVVAYALPRHPGNVIGTWAAGPSVSVTFDEQGRVSLNGTGFAPPFLADLHNLGRWDVAAGKLRLTTHDPGSPERTSKCRYSFKDGGNTLELTPSEGTTTWRFPREKR